MPILGKGGGIADPNTPLSGEVTGSLGATTVEVTKVDWGTEVQVYEATDFPTPSGGIIQLADNTAYRLRASNIPLTTGDSIRAGANCAIVGSDSGSAGILGDNSTQTVLVPEGAVLAINGVQVNNAGSGRSFLAESTGTPILLRGCEFDSPCESAIAGSISAVLCFFAAGIVAGGSGSVSLDSIAAFAPTGGAAIDIVSGANLSLSVESGSLITLDAGAFSLRQDAGATVTNSLISRVTFAGAGTSLSGITPGSIGWRFEQNTDSVDDSVDQAISTRSGALTTIDLPTGQAWVPISDRGVAITWALADDNQKFVLSDVNTGELEYLGLPTKTFGFTLSVGFRRSGAEFQALAVQFAFEKDSVVDAHSIIGESAGIIASVTTAVIPTVPIVLSTGDKVRPVVRNVDGTDPADDIDVNSMHFSVLE